MTFQSLFAWMVISLVVLKEDISLLSALVFGLLRLAY